MKTSRIALALPFVLVVLTGACSSSKGSGVVTEIMPAEPVDGGASTDAAPDTATIDPPKKDAAVPPQPPVGECGAETTQTACATCCSNKHENGAGVYFVALIDCMCLAANCAKDCATTICVTDAPKNPDAACNACIAAKNTACAAVTKATCTADPDCVAFDACVGQSGCLSKTN